MMTFVYREQRVQELGIEEAFASAGSDPWNLPLFLELRGLRERIWVGGAREKAFSDKLRASRDPATSNSPPTGTFQHWKVETFFPQESCVLFQSLTVEPLIHMEEVHRGNRHCQVQSCIQPRLWGQGKQLSLETHKTCSTPLRAERQKHTNFFRSCLISFPHIKYPIFLTLGGSCGMASCSQNIRKHNAKKKKKTECFCPFLLRSLFTK